MKIAFIGGGVMAEAIMRAILDKKLTMPAAITVSDINPKRLAALSQRFGVTTTEDNGKALEKGETVILAIKPQNLTEVMSKLKGFVTAQQLILSIVAGASVATISQGLGHSKVVRVMPNTPAQIGEGMSVWTATSAVGEGQREAAQAILQALGKELYVPDERYIDMATAVSGSGPAYIFLIIESLIDSAVHIGLPRDMAHELVLQTVLGATRLVQASGKLPAELRNMVTSPGGVTAEALLQLEEGGLRATLMQAVIAAYEKTSLMGEVEEGK